MNLHGNLAIAVEDTDAELVLHVHGDVDASTIDRFRSVLDASTATDASTVVVDLHRCTLLGACGLAALAHTRHALDERGGELQVREPSCTMVCVLHAVGLGDLLPGARPTAHRS